MAVSPLIVSYVLDEIRRRTVKFKAIKRAEPDRHLHGGSMASFWQGPHPGEREECEESSPWEEEAAETMYDELTTALIPCPLCCWEGGGGKKMGLKLNPRRREEWGKVFIKVLFLTILL